MKSTLLIQIQDRGLLIFDEKRTLGTAIVWNDLNPMELDTFKARFENSITSLESALQQEVTSEQENS